MAQNPGDRQKGAAGAGTVVDMTAWRRDHNRPSGDTGRSGTPSTAAAHAPRQPHQGIPSPAGLLAFPGYSSADTLTDLQADPQIDPRDALQREIRGTLEHQIMPAIQDGELRALLFDRLREAEGGFIDDLDRLMAASTDLQQARMQRQDRRFVEHQPTAFTQADDDALGSDIPGGEPVLPVFDNSGERQRGDGSWLEAELRDAEQSFGRFRGIDPIEPFDESEADFSGDLFLEPATAPRQLQSPAQPQPRPQSTTLRLQPQPAALQVVSEQPAPEQHAAEQSASGYADTGQPDAVSGAVVSFKTAHQAARRYKSWGLGWLIDQVEAELNDARTFQSILAEMQLELDTLEGAVTHFRQSLQGPETTAAQDAPALRQVCDIAGRPIK